MTTSIAEAILTGANQLRRAGVPEARREAGSLLSHVIGRDRGFLLTHADDVVSADQFELMRQSVARRAAGEPLQYITGRQEFFGLDFEVTPAVLIPRPETELLVEIGLKLLADAGTAPFICDVGTGSGCLAISLLHELPESRAVAVDVSPDALAVARRNAARHSMTNRLEFVVSDCFAALNAKNSDQSNFHLIVSNPPYVEEHALADLQREVRDFEPRIALIAGPDGLEIIRRLLVDARKFVRPEGFFVFEIGFNQSEKVRTLIDPKIWTLVGFFEDLQSIPRVVALQKHS
ncbi:MAG TPA: peptide chain release factor N(5)-glutamine methyltransferase [Pyrinomonadaceae bacterium]|nr:peptide chain release factor N(5)-glutamine methyltransferase [Pyrinomonadaceae bacterium]